MKFSFGKIFVVAAVLCVGAGFFGTAHAATVTWTGGGGNANWSNAANWSGTGSAPGASDVATFGVCSSNCSPTIDTTINVGGISIASPYGGTITQGSGNSVTVGSSGYTQGAGTFVGSSGAGDSITVNGSFVQTAGTFTSTAGTLGIENNMTLTSGTFNHNNGTVSFISGNDSVITCSATSFHLVSFNKTGGSGHDGIEVLSGCTIPLGSNVTSSFNAENWGFNDPTYGNGQDALINYGTITVTGNWNINEYVCGDPSAFNYGTISVTGNISFSSCFANILNYATTTVGGSSWTGGGIINEAATSTFTFGGTAMTVYDSFEVTSGTAKFNGSTTGLTLTVGESSNDSADTYIGCTSSQLSQVVFSKNAGGHAGVVVYPGCTIPLGNNPTANFAEESYSINDPYNNNNGQAALINYGTVTASGTLTVNDGNCGNYPVFNYGLINVTGTIAFNGCITDIVNYATTTVTGTSWTGGGLVNAATTSTFNYGGTAITVYDDFVVGSGTAKFNGSTTGLTLTVGYAGSATNDSVIGCTSAQLSQVVFSKTGSGHAGTEVLSGCVVPLGVNPTANFSDDYYNLNDPYNNNSGDAALVNFGTVTASGTLTMTENNCGNEPVFNYGLINVTGTIAFNGCITDIVNYATTTVTGTSWTGGGLVNAATTSTFNYGGTAITVYDDFVVGSGTAKFNGSTTGLTLTVGMTGSATNDSVIGCTSAQFSQVIFNKSTSYSHAGTEVLAGCVVPLGSNPTANFDTDYYNLNDPYNNNSGDAALVNFGTVTASGTLTVDENSCGLYPIFNYGLINVTGTIAFNTCFSDIVNYATTTVTGGSWTGGGIVNAATTSTFTFPSGTMTADYDVVFGNGTTPNAMNLTLATAQNQTVYFAPGSSTFSGIVINKSGNTVNYDYASTSTTDTGNFSFLGGTLPFSGSGTYTLIVQGNYINGSGNAFGTASTTLSMTGSSSSTINEGTGTFGGSIIINKTGIVTAQLASSLIAASGTCAVSGGTFDMYSFNLTCGGGLTVSSGGWLADYSGYASTLTLGGSVTNNGVIFLDGSGPDCTIPYPQYMSIVSTASGTQRAWSGSGEFVIRSAYVQDQTASPAITVWNGTMSHDTGWSAAAAGVGRPGYVQDTAWSEGGGSGVTLPAFTYWPRPGDDIFVAVSANNESVVNVPTDSAGNTYKLAATSTATGPEETYLYYAQGVSSTKTFTVHVTGTGSFMTAAAYEFVGLAVSSTLDTISTNVDNTGMNTALTSGSASGHSTSDELYFGIVTAGSFTDAITDGTGWTALPGYNYAGIGQEVYPEFESLSSIPAGLAATWTAASPVTYGAVLGVFASPGAQASSYAPTGTLDSAIFDTKSVTGAQLNSVTWYGLQPTGTHVGFQFAVSNSSSGPWSYIGPSGDGSQYFTAAANTTIPLVSNLSSIGGYSMFSGFRYFRYRTELSADSFGLYTPTVTGINVNWSP